MHAVQCVARGKCQKESQAFFSLGHGKMKADIAEGAASEKDMSSIEVG